MDPLHLFLSKVRKLHIRFLRKCGHGFGILILCQKEKTFCGKLACSNALATKANLFHRHLSTTPTCNLFQSAPETVEHVLFTCPWTSAVWFGHPIGLRIYPASITSLDRWIEHLILVQNDQQLPRRSEVFTIIIYFFWEIWKHRCLCVFYHQVPSPAAVIKKAIQSHIEFLCLPKKLHALPRADILVCSSLNSLDFFSSQ